VPDNLARGKRSIAVNLKVPGGVQLLKKMIAQADVLIDPFRIGVLERLGLGPDVFLGNTGLNRKLVYTRIIGQVSSCVLSGTVG
jgi:alpha-methylacyl-CoA racemase